RCHTLNDVADAWSNLKEVRKDDEAYGQARKLVPQLERCRKASQTFMRTGADEALRRLMMSQRAQVAEEYESKLLDLGIDATVTTIGTDKDQLVLKWVLMNKVAVHQMTKDTGFTEHLEKLGFRRVTWTDGYETSFHADLHPESEKEALKK